MTNAHDHPFPTRAINASEFRARCLALMDEVAAGSGDIVITKHGRPIARLTTVRMRPDSMFGADRGRMKITGDVINPIDLEWDAISEPDRVINP